MAKKSGSNKSEAIRESLKELPNAPAKEVVAHVKEKQGIDVTEGLVYQVKKVAAKTSGRKPARKKAAAVAAAPMEPAAVASSNGRLSLGASITAVKGLAAQVGGLAELKEIVDALQ